MSRAFLTLAGIFACLGLFSDFAVIAYSCFLVLVFVYVLRRPHEGAWCVVLTLAVAASVFPWDFVSEFGGDAPESFWYWGVGLIAVGAAMTVVYAWRSLVSGVRSQERIRRDSRSARRLKWAVCLFALIVVLASLHGFRLGNSPAVIVRQGTGLILLFLFVFLGARFSGVYGNSIRTFERARLVVLAYSLIYLVRHVLLNLQLQTTLPMGDFVRERSPILFFAGLFAALSVWETLFGYRPISIKHVATALVLILTGLFSGSRAIIAATVITIVVGLLIKYRKKPVRILVWSTAAVLVVAANPFQLILSLSEGRGFMEHMVQRFVVSPLEDSSFVQRASQMISVGEVIGSSPILGNGVGGSITWFEPYTLTTVETAFVDNGIGYLLLKMGLSGTMVFAYLSWLFWRTGYRLLVQHSMALAIPLTASLVYYTAYLPFGPSFFQFFNSPWIGLVLGYLISATAFVDTQRACRRGST